MRGRGENDGDSFYKEKTSGLYGGTDTGLEKVVRILLESSTWIPGLR